MELTLEFKATADGAAWRRSAAEPGTGYLEPSAIATASRTNSSRVGRCSREIGTRDTSLPMASNEHVAKFTWARTAAATMEVYRSIT